MILLTFVIDEEGMMWKAAATGHASGLHKGGNIVCAAVTILIRTAARLLEDEIGVMVSGGPGVRGDFSLVIESVDPEKIGFVKAIGDYLMQGMRDLQAEFPGDCIVKVTQRS